MTITADVPILAKVLDMAEALRVMDDATLNDIAVRIMVGTNSSNTDDREYVETLVVFETSPRPSRTSVARSQG